jgi:hypothetical protein
MKKKKVKSPKALPTIPAVAAPEVIPKRPTIAELEAILNEEQDRHIEILPNGEVRAVEGKPDPQKPLTFREQFGGEYGEVA